MSEKIKKTKPIWIDHIPFCSSKCECFVEKLKLDGTSRKPQKWVCLLSGIRLQYCEPVIKEEQRKFKQLERFVKNAKSKAMKCSHPKMCLVFTTLNAECVRLNEGIED